LIGNHEQIAGLVKRKLNGIERIIPHDGKLARRRRPAINLLPFGIDKIEVAGTIDSAAGNIEEAANEFLYSGAIGEDWSGSRRNSLRLVSGNGEPCKFALANFNLSVSTTDYSQSFPAAGERLRCGNGAGGESSRQPPRVHSCIVRNHDRPRDGPAVDDVRAEL
jgi:hypothetical protein